MSDDDGRSTGDLALFVIFLFAVLLLVTLPLTVWRIRAGGGSHDGVLRPWLVYGKRKGKVPLKRYVNAVNLTLVLVWTIILVLGVFVATIDNAQEQPFDPYAILGISQDADEKAVEKQYRKLAVVYHPDKPTGSPALFESITKAKNALLNEEARENWKKYGHPDGRQPYKINVALPMVFFSSDPRISGLVMLGLVFFGFAVPILSLSLYLWQTEGYHGANRVMEQTLAWYHLYGVKEMLRVNKMVDNIVVANEFILLPLKRDAAAALQRCMLALNRRYQVPKQRQEKLQRGEFVRTLLFLTAYLERDDDQIPKELEGLYHDTIRWVPPLCEEFARESCARRARMSHGWFYPAEAAIQLQQCVLQQVRVDVRVPPVDGTSKKKKGVTGEAAAALFQLPGLENDDQLRALEKLKIRSLQDLCALTPEQRSEKLLEAGIEADKLAAVEDMLLCLPQPHITAFNAYVDGEDDIKQQDLVTVVVHMAVTRPGHYQKAQPIRKGTKNECIEALTPRFPGTAHEKWYLMLVNNTTKPPTVWGYKPLNFVEAEEAGLKHCNELGCCWYPQAKPEGADAAAARQPSNTDAKAGSDKQTPPGTDGPIGQKVEFKMFVPEACKLTLAAVVMPSCWIGCDASSNLSFQVLEQTAEEKKNKFSRSKARVEGFDEDGNEIKADDDDDDDDDDEDDDGDSEGWDTDETGTDITHDEEDEAGNTTSGKNAEGSKSNTDKASK